jgi:ADP-heptose:LPS heptosyltransferase
VIGDDVWATHLAARLGIPSIVLLAPGADWLWGPHPGPSPWYASLEVLPAGDEQSLAARLATLSS